MTRSPTRVLTPCLDIAVEVAGPEGGAPVILLHGWPDDVRCWGRLLTPLHAAGFRTYAPWLRGFGPTRFRDATTPRSGALSALGQDALDLIEALGLGRVALVGHDWGARAAYIAACLAPGRVSALCALSVGWGTNASDQPLSFRQAQNYWYHWLMALPRGEAIVLQDRHAFTRYIWEIWNPGWDVSEEEFAATAAAFDNPDWADVVLHSYRVRWGHAPPDPRYFAIEARLAADPLIHVPTLVLHGGADPCNEPATSEGREPLFRAHYERVVLPSVGHFPQRQAPEDVAAALLPFLHRHLAKAT